MKQLVKFGQWIDFFLKKLSFFFTGITKYLRTDELHGLSPGVAFYFIIGFIPFLVFIANVIMFFTVAQLDSIIELLYAYFPGKIAMTIEDDIQRIVSQRSDLWMWMGLLASTISFEQGLAVLVRATDHSYYKDASIWDVHSKAILYVIGLLLAILLSLGLTVFGNAIVQFLDYEFQLPTVFLSTWSLLRFLLPFLALIMFLTIFYWTAPPNIRCNIAHIKTCAIAAFMVTFLWLTATGIYSWIMLFIPSMGECYGSFFGLFVLFMWFQYIALIIIIGIGFIKTWDKWNVLQHQWKRINEVQPEIKYGDFLEQLTKKSTFWEDDCNEEFFYKLTK